MLRALPLIAALAVVASSVPAAALADAPPAVTVVIRDMKYAPDTLTIAVGTKVTWINRDTMPHTVTDRTHGFASAALDTGESYSYTFATPGEFTYSCVIHPFMVGKVVVKPAGASP
jgi:plastocyanin